MRLRKDSLPMGTFGKVMLALGFVVLAGFGSCAVCVAVGAKGVSDHQERAKKEVEQGRASAQPVALVTLLKEYKDNEVRADSQFKGKFIRVSGSVGDVKKDIADKAYVTLGTGAAFEIPQVQCMLSDSSIARASSLSKGAPVEVSGRVEGLMMNVLVRDCEIL